MSSLRLGFVCLLVLAASVSAAAATRNVNVGQGGGLSFTDSVSGTSTTTITVGDTVHWIWVSGVHTVTSGTCSTSCTPDQVFASGSKSSGTFDVTFTQANTFPYFCSVHGAIMTGTIIVQPAQTGPVVGFQASAAVNLPGSNGNSSLAVADFNGDGLPDVAVTSATSNNLNILLANANGTGTLNAPTAKTGMTAPKMVVAADLNGDNRPDLITANATDVSVLLNDGTGQFGSALSRGAAAHPSAVAVADFNNDLKADIAVSDTTATSLQMLTGDGAGGFSSGTPVAVAATSGFVAAGLLNTGTNQDLAVLLSPNTVRSFTGDGALNFSGVGTAAAAGTTPTAFALGNFSPTGPPSVVVAASGSDAVEFLANNGDGSFATAVALSTGTNSAPMAVAVGDFNNDGFADVVSANKTSGSVSVFMGNGNNTFNPAQNFPVPSGSLTGVGVGDFNNDNALDIVVSSGVAGTNAVTVLLNKRGTGISVVSNHPSATAGTSVTLTATVSASVPGTGTPAGTANFLDGNATIASNVTLNAGGQAQFTTSTLAPGLHSIKVHYNGSSNFHARDSANFQQTIKVDTTTTLGSSANPAIEGDPVTLTATVTNVQQGGSGPGGNVSFTDGANLLSQPNVEGSTAVLVTSSLAKGTHSISATYNGDSLHNSSTTANALSQEIDPRVTVNPTSLDFGNVQLGTTTVAKTVSVTNNGADPVDTTQETISGDFSMTNDCGGSLAHAASCSFFVKFAPQSAGTQNAALMHNSTVDVNLSGTGLDFTFTIVRPVRSTRGGAVGAANPAKHTFTFAVGAPANTIGSVRFHCAGLPQGASCRFTPATVELANGGRTTTLEVNTVPRRAARFGATGGTPAGTYVLQVVAESGTIKRIIPLEITVR